MKILATIIVLTLMVVSFVIGTRVGVYSFEMSAAKTEASATTGFLQTFTPESCKRYLEIKRDRSLILHGENQQSVLRYLWPELNKEGTESSIVLAAKYRSEHPTQFPPEGLPLSNEQRQALIKEEAMLQKVTEEYAK